MIRKYEKYKSVKSSFFKAIPEEWSRYKIKNIVDKNIYYPVGDGDHGAIRPEMYKEEGIPYIRVQNLTWHGEITYEGMVYIDHEVQDANKKSILLPGDILIAKTGATIGKLGFIPESIIEANTTSSVGKVTIDKSRFHPKYILYCFQSSNFNDQIWLGASQKSAQPGFNIDDLIVLEILAPTLFEQTQIAHFLDHETSIIDEIIHRKEKQIKLLKEKRQSIINEVVTKGLNPNEKMKDSGIKWIGNIPEDWKICKLKHIVSMQSGSSITSESIEDEGDFPVFGGNGLRGYVNTFTNDGEFVLIGRQGALCGNINYAKGKFWASEHAVVVYPIVELDSFYLGEMLRIMNLNQYSESAAQPGLSVNKILNLRIPKIPLEEQIKISTFIKNETIRLDDLVSKINSQIGKLKEYRQSLISEAVTGKIDVRDWQPPSIN